MATTTSTTGGTAQEHPDAGKRNRLEPLPAFIPTPERISQYLERNTQEVEAQLSSVDGRRQLAQELGSHEADLRKTYPDFRADRLERELDRVGTTLTEKRRFLEQIQVPEKKNLFRRAFDRVKTFAKKHPVVTTLAVVALTAAGVAAGFYLTGNWELLMSRVGLSKIFTGAKAAETLVPPTPVTPPLPGGGVYDIPAPIMPPDIVPGT